MMVFPTFMPIDQTRTVQYPTTSFGYLEINCLINADQFRFPDSNDFFEVNYGNDSKKYYFPYKVESFFDMNDEGVWNITCTVADIFETLQITNNPFDIDPIGFVFKNGSPPKKLSNDITRIIFDSTPPNDPILTIHTTIVEPEKNVEFEVTGIEDNGNGVGTWTSEEEIHRSPPGFKPAASKI